MSKKSTATPRPTTRATGIVKGHAAKGKPPAKSKPANKKRDPVPKGWTPSKDHLIKPDASTKAETGPEPAARDALSMSASVTPAPGGKGKLKIDLMNVPEGSGEDLTTVEKRREIAANGPPQLQRAVRRVEAFNLRVAGYDYRQIHQALNEAGYKCSIKTCYYDVQETLRELSTFERVLAEDVRAMQLARLDQLMAGLSDTAFAGDTYAVEAYLRVLDHQAKLLGIYAPTEVTVNHRRPLHNATPEELAKLLERMTTSQPLPVRVLNSLGPVSDPSGEAKARTDLPDIEVRDEANEVDPPEVEREDEAEVTE